ncbi:MAG: cation transporter [SAR202 cluster bacterium]|nr:cation transporter [SAR202 cluster bacterium]
MEFVFKITGMTCQGCADTIEKGFASDSKILASTVSLENNELTIESDETFTIEQIDQMLSEMGNYSVNKQSSTGLFSTIVNYLSSKKPILLALAVVFLSSLSVEFGFGRFDLTHWLMTYMGIFFILFSFLKLLDVKSFSISFSRYDILAKNIPGFAVTYPFIEFLLGVAFLTRTMLIFTNIITLVLMISQVIGVVNILKGKKIIQCACMGSSIDLSVSHITLFENLVMILMSSYMIFKLIS